MLVFCFVDRNPNTPEAVVDMTWPEFELHTQMFIDLDDQITTIRAPDVDIHNTIISNLHPMRRRRVEADKVVNMTKSKDCPDVVVNTNDSRFTGFSFAMLLLGVAFVMLQ